MQVSQEDLISLIEASLDANYSNVKTISSRIAKAIVPQDVEVAKAIKAVLKRKGVPLRSSGYSETLPVDPKSRMPLLEEQSWPVSPLFLNAEARGIFKTFISDISNVELLIQHGLGGRLNMLLSGPPGTGKTLVAGHIAAHLGRPLYVVRLDSVMSSLLGDTAKNIRSIFEYVPSKNGVLFLDEVDAVAKLRDDKHELGEIKRVVNTLIQGLDYLDDTAVVIAATNHSGLLDPAIWRRFPYKINFGLPDRDMRSDLWNHFLFLDGGDASICAALAVISEGMTGSDVEGLAIAVRRRGVLSNSKVDIPSLVKSLLSRELNYVQLPSDECLEGSEKKKLASVLSREYEISQATIGKLLNVSRQAISSYLKE